MNKDLKKEYQEFITEDVPDLWDKIEAGLEPRKSDVKTSFLKSYHIWGMAAAACLCVAVTVPVLFGWVSNNSSSKSDSAIMENMLSDIQDAMDGDYAPSYDGYMAAEDVAPAEDAENAAGSDSIEEFCTITAIVTDIIEEEKEKVYLVQILETDRSDLSVGESIKLYDRSNLNEELLEGETYLCDIMIINSYGDEEEFYLYDIR